MALSTLSASSLPSRARWGSGSGAASTATGPSSMSSCWPAWRDRRRRRTSSAAVEAVLYTYDVLVSSICSLVPRARQSRIRTSCITSSTPSSSSRYRRPTCRTIAPNFVTAASRASERCCSASCKVMGRMYHVFGGSRGGEKRFHRGVSGGPVGIFYVGPVPRLGRLTDQPEAPALEGLHPAPEGDPAGAGPRTLQVSVADDDVQRPPGRMLRGSGE